MNKLAHLTSQQQKELFEQLLYLNMQELKQLCEYFTLPKSGKKGQILERIKQFLLTGVITQQKPLPTVSCGMSELVPNGLILYGSYKNNQATRELMKQLVGKHFHFTAWGQDWIRGRWEEGNPPTYKEFAKAWQSNYEASKGRQASPKKEWALLNFCMTYAKKHSQAS